MLIDDYYKSDLKYQAWQYQIKYLVQHIQWSKAENAPWEKYSLRI